jgi:excisionase family DNA binding protein
MSEPIVIALPAELIEAIARRVAELLDKSRTDTTAATSPWMDFDTARDYLRLTRDQLYKLTAARAIPVRKREGGQRLLFHRDELDTWLETAYPRLDRLP